MKNPLNIYSSIILIFFGVMMLFMGYDISKIEKERDFYIEINKKQSDTIRTYRDSLYRWNTHSERMRLIFRKDSIKIQKYVD